MNRVSAMAVLDLHDILLSMGTVTPEQLKQKGLDRASLLARLNTLEIKQEHLHQHHKKPRQTQLQERCIDESCLLGLWSLADFHSQVPELGLLIGKEFNAEAKGLLANWVSQCDTLGEAMQTFRKHIVLMNPSESWQMIQNNDQVALTFRFAADKGYPLIAIERSLCALLTWAKILSGQNIIPVSSHFQFNKPPYVELYKDIFGVNTKFNQSENRITFNADVFSRPINNANAYFKQVIAERARQTFDQLQQRPGITHQVMQVIEANLQEGVDVDVVCEKLHLSRPTLYRKLKAEGSSFSTLLNVHRKEIALQQLKQGVNITCISLNLGFKDTGTFFKAFKRWTGFSPGEYMDH